MIQYEVWACSMQANGTNERTFLHVFSHILKAQDWAKEASAYRNKQDRSGYVWYEIRYVNSSKRLDEA